MGWNDFVKFGLWFSQTKPHRLKLKSQPLPLDHRDWEIRIFERLRLKFESPRDWESETEKYESPRPWFFSLYYNFYSHFHLVLFVRWLVEFWLSSILIKFVSGFWSMCDIRSSPVSWFFLSELEIWISFLIFWFNWVHIWFHEKCF